MCSLNGENGISSYALSSLCIHILGALSQINMNMCNLILLYLLKYLFVCMYVYMLFSFIFVNGMAYEGDVGSTTLLTTSSGSNLMHQSERYLLQTPSLLRRCVFLTFLIRKQLPISRMYGQRVCGPMTSIQLMTPTLSNNRKNKKKKEE